MRVHWASKIYHPGVGFVGFPQQQTACAGNSLLASCRWHPASRRWGIRKTGSIPTNTLQARDLEPLRCRHRDRSRVMPACVPRLPGDCTRMIAVADTSLRAITRQTRHWPRPVCTDGTTERLVKIVGFPGPEPPCADSASLGAVSGASCTSASGEPESRAHADKHPTNPAPEPLRWLHRGPLRMMPGCAPRALGIETWITGAASTLSPQGNPTNPTSA